MVRRDKRDLEENEDKVWYGKGGEKDEWRGGGGSRRSGKSAVRR